jgi:hypothetical protein
MSSKMEDGRWKREEGRWKMEEGRWKKSQLMSFGYFLY